MRGWSELSEERRAERRAYQRQWALRHRAAVINELGGRCELCGTQRYLTVDLIEPQAKYHARGNGGGRPKQWREAMEAGNAQVLCARCNTVKKRKGREWRAPFPRMKYHPWRMFKDRKDWAAKVRGRQMVREAARVLAARAACEERNGRPENN
jgi:hypothetical protein